MVSISFESTDCQRLSTHLFATAADVLSSVEFDHTGRFLATGDKGGRIVIFENNGDVNILFRISHFKFPDAIFDFRELRMEEKLAAIISFTQSFKVTKLSLIT
jgi:serine/threonine-protein phosphatase 2A regulatory subunit B